MASSPPSPHFFAILSWGGIGDTLRNLSQYPHAALHRRFGWQLPVVHQPWQEIGCREDALPPGPAAIRDLVERCPSLTWGGVGTLNPLAKNLSRVARLGLLASHLGSPPLFPMQILLADTEKAGLPTLNDNFNIGVQTHLMGMPSKIWPVEKWRHFLALLRKKHPHAHIHLIEPSPRAEELLLDDRFHSYSHYHLAQSIQLVRQMSYVISVDSWVKYVAAWDRVPQSIIIPDQRADYPKLTATSLLKHEFATLKTLREVRLIGLDRKTNQLNLPTLSEVDPEKLFSSLENFIPAQNVHQRF